ncbi:hypothetical protein RJ640_000802 [Escallonia rubra]|uniref:ALOG domain-containing protein n=1 Tax=Escallonia rubra TaxID=112253 RepID=A0AA88S1P5_9ASTE|nr:hypothetical protein RJ640_000802 [Escallonia rubra]
MENPRSMPTTLGWYENQKRRDWNTFAQYIHNHRLPLSLARCSGAHVLEFFRYLNQFGKTKENRGKPESNLFGARAVRLYLRKIRDSQSKARGSSYEKKKRCPPYYSSDLGHSFQEPFRSWRSDRHGVFSMEMASIAFSFYSRRLRAEQTPDELQSQSPHRRGLNSPNTSDSTFLAKPLWPLTAAPPLAATAASSFTGATSSAASSDVSRAASSAEATSMTLFSGCDTAAAPGFPSGESGVGKSNRVKATTFVPLFAPHLLRWLLAVAQVLLKGFNGLVNEFVVGRRVPPEPIARACNSRNTRNRTRRACGACRISSGSSSFRQKQWLDWWISLTW